MWCHNALKQSYEPVWVVLTDLTKVCGLALVASWFCCLCGGTYILMHGCRHSRVAVSTDHLTACPCHRCCVSPTMVTITLVGLDSHTSRPCAVLMCEEPCGEMRGKQLFLVLLHA